MGPCVVGLLSPGVQGTVPVVAAWPVGERGGRLLTLCEMGTPWLSLVPYAATGYRPTHLLMITMDERWSMALTSMARLSPDGLPKAGRRPHATRMPRAVVRPLCRA